ncbi:alpha-amylase family glycosyl hydrolase [Aquirufa sp. ROCK-SH2]
MPKNTSDKFVVYQMMFHLWGNKTTDLKMNGSLAENGVTKFDDVSTKGLKALKKKGYTHLYATGLIEHATMEDMSAFGSPLDHPDVVKGRCGSPFAIKDYYDVNPFFAKNPSNRWNEFDQMLQRIHKEGLQLIIDFVPNHLARQYHSDQKPKGITDFGSNDRKDTSFDINNNFYYLPGTQFSIPNGVQSPVQSPVQSTIPYVEIPAKVSGNNVFSAQPSINDWFETVKLNYGIDFQNHQQKHFDPIPDTWKKMLEVLNYWTLKGVDGFRCDMAEMVPVEFWEYAIPKIKLQNPHIIFIAEIYQPNLYKDYIFKGGFDYLYDKVGLYDALRRLMELKPEASTQDITRVWQNESGDFSNHMLRFLENHDEHRLNTPAFAAHNFWSSIPAMVITAALHDGPLMVYFGQEFGEKAQDKEGFNQADDRTSMFDFWAVNTHQRWLNEGKFDGGLLNHFERQVDHFYTDLLAYIKKNKAIQNGQFFDLQYAQNDSYPKDKIYSFLRYTEKEQYLIVCSFEPKETRTFSIEIPELALGMMGLKNYQLIENKSFISPESPEDANISNGILRLPANSVCIYKLTKP